MVRNSAYITPCFQPNLFVKALLIELYSTYDEKEDNFREKVDGYILIDKLFNCQVIGISNQKHT